MRIMHSSVAEMALPSARLAATTDVESTTNSKQPNSRHPEKERLSTLYPQQTASLSLSTAAGHRRRHRRHRPRATQVPASATTPAHETPRSARSRWRRWRNDGTWSVRTRESTTGSRKPGRWEERRRGRRSKCGMLLCPLPMDVATRKVCHKPSGGWPSKITAPDLTRPTDGRSYADCGYRPAINWRDRILERPMIWYTRWLSGSLCCENWGDEVGGEVETKK